MDGTWAFATPRRRVPIVGGPAARWSRALYVMYYPGAREWGSNTSKTTRYKRVTDRVESCFQSLPHVSAPVIALSHARALRSNTCGLPLLDFSQTLMRPARWRAERISSIHSRDLARRAIVQFVGVVPYNELDRSRIIAGCVCA